MKITPEAQAVVTALQKNLEIHYTYGSIVRTLTDTNDENHIADVLSAFYNEPFFRVKIDGPYGSPIDLVSASGLVVCEDKFYAAGGLKDCNGRSGGVAVSLHKIDMLKLAIGAVPPGFKIADPHFARHAIYAYGDANFCIWKMTLAKIFRSMVASWGGAFKIRFNSKFGANRDANIDRQNDPNYKPTIFIPTEHDVEAEDDNIVKIVDDWKCIGRNVNGQIELFDADRGFEEFELFTKWRKLAIERFHNG